MTPAEISSATQFELRVITLVAGDNLIVSSRPGRVFLGIYPAGGGSNALTMKLPQSGLGESIPPNAGSGGGGLGWTLTFHDWAGLLANEWHVLAGVPLNCYVIDAWIG